MFFDCVAGMNTQVDFIRPMTDVKNDPRSRGETRMNYRGLANAIRWLS